MIELIEANWLLILLAVLVGFVIAWFLLSGSRKTRVRRDETGEEVGTKRNQALIDAPPAAAKDAEPAPEPQPEPKPESPSEPAPERPAPTPEPAQEPAAHEPTVPPTGLAGAGAAVGAAVGRDTTSDSEPAQVSPAPSPTPAHAPSADEGSDDLTRLKGVGPKLAAQLHTLGVTSFAQIAAWSEADIDRIDGQLGRFQGRIRRDNWIEQAKLLESGDTAAYEARFGKL
ncbi:hypothetical protein [Alteriqipengyuania sp. 357]